MSSGNSFPYNSHHVPPKNPSQYKSSLPSHNINQTFHQQPLAGGYVRPEYVAPQNWASYSTSQHPYVSQQTSPGSSAGVDGNSGRSDGMVPTSQAQARATATSAIPPAHQNQNGVGARQVSGAGAGGYDYVTAYSHESNYSQVSSAPSASADSMQSQFRTTAPSPQQYFNYSSIPQHTAAGYAPAYQAATSTASTTHISQTHQTHSRTTNSSLQQPRSQISGSSAPVPEKLPPTYTPYQSTHNTAPPQQQPLFSTTQNHSLLTAAIGQSTINNPQDSNAQSTPTTRSATPEVSYSSGPSYQKTNVQAASQQPLSMMRTQLPTGSSRQTPIMGSSAQSNDREEPFRAVRPSRGNGESMQNIVDVQDQHGTAPNYARTLQEQHQEYQYQQAQSQAEARAQAQARAEAKAREEERAQAEAKAQAIAKAQAEALAQAEARTRAEAQAQAQAQVQAEREAQLQAQAPNHSQVTKKPRKRSEGRAKQQKSSYQSLDQHQVNQQYQQVTQQYQQQHQQRQQQSQQRDYQQPQQYRFYQPPVHQTARANNQQQLETCAQPTPSRDADTHLPPLAVYHPEPEQHHEVRESQQRPETYSTSHPHSRNSMANPSQYPLQYQPEPHQTPQHEPPSQKSFHNPQPQPVSQPQPHQPSQYHSPPEPQYPAQEQQSHHLPHSTSQTQETPEPKSANLGPIDPSVLEQQMRDMVERMRYYQSQDPHTFQAVWDSVRKNSSNTNAIAGVGDDGHPKAIMPNTGSSQHRISNVSSPPSISSPLVRPVSVASIEKRTASETPPQPSQNEIYEDYHDRLSSNHGVNPVVDSLPPSGLVQQNWSAPQQPEQPLQPPQVTAQAVPSDQVPTPPNPSSNTPSVSRAIITRDAQAPSNNTNKRGWDIGQKKRVARAVASYLCSTSGSVISEEAVMELLDKNNHFVSLCEKLESRGFKFDRGVFARKLLQETSGARMEKPKAKEGESRNGGARVLGEVDDKQEKDIQEKQQQVVNPSLIVKLPLQRSAISTSTNTGTLIQRQSSPRAVDGVLSSSSSSSPAPPPTTQTSTHSTSTTAPTRTPLQTVTSSTTASRGRGRPRKNPIETNSGPPKTPAAQIIQPSSLPTPPVTVTSNSKDSSLPSIISSPLFTPAPAPSLGQGSQLQSRGTGHESVGNRNISDIPRNPTPQSVRAAYAVPPSLPYNSLGHRKNPQFVTPSLVFRTPTPPVPAIHPTPLIITTTTATTTFGPGHPSSFPSEMPSSNSKASSGEPQKSGHTPGKHHESEDGREEARASAGPSDKQKSLVVKLHLSRLSEPKALPHADNPPVVDLTHPTPEPRSINSSPNPESAATNSREAQKTKRTSSEPSVMPARAPKPEITLAEQPVSPIMRSAVGRRSRYDPNTIVMDLLRTIGRHPTLPALNSGLEVLRDTLPNYFRAPVDLATIRWDILDPPPPSVPGDETEDETEVLDRSLGMVGVGGGLVGVVASTAPAPRKKGRKRKSDVASSVPGPVLPTSTSSSFPRPRGRPKKGTSATPIRSSTTSNTSRDTGGPSNFASHIQPSGVSMSGADILGQGSSPRAGSSEAGGRQRASVGASSLRNVSTPSGSNIAVLIPTMSGASRSEYLTTPSNNRKRKSEERAEGGRAGKTPKLSVKPRSQKSNRPEPSGFKIFECRWKHCRARLHNFENLRKHVFKAHKKLTAYNAYACLWASCHREPPEEMKNKAKELGTVLPDKISHDFKIDEEWEAHMDEKHLAQVKEELGLGPAVLPSDCESGISDVDYMSDRDGHPVTPLAVLAPPGYRFTPPPGFPVNPQFRLAHGLPAPSARRRRNTTGREGALGVVRNLAAGSSDPEKPDDDDNEGWKADQIPTVGEEDVQMEGN